MNTKVKELGQFYTTNSNYILSDMEISVNDNFIEPFVGNGDLTNWLNTKGVSNVETYDIDPKIECNEVRDTLLILFNSHHNLLSHIQQDLSIG